MKNFLINVKLMIALLTLSMIVSCESDESQVDEAQSFDNLSVANIDGLLTSKGKTTVSFLPTDVVITHNGSLKKSFIVRNENQFTQNYTIENSEIVFSDYGVIVRDLDNSKIYSFQYNIDEFLENTEGKVEIKKIEEIVIKNNIDVNTNVIGALATFSDVVPVDIDNIDKYSNGYEYAFPSSYRIGGDKPCGAFVCDSGGVGSTGCGDNFGGSVAGTGGTTGCSVTVGPGFYACCSVLFGCYPCPNDGGGPIGGGGTGTGPGPGTGGGGGGTSDCYFQFIQVEVTYEDGSSERFTMVALICE